MMVAWLGGATVKLTNQRPVLHAACGFYFRQDAVTITLKLLAKRLAGKDTVFNHEEEGRDPWKPGVFAGELSGAAYSRYGGQGP